MKTKRNKPAWILLYLFGGLVAILVGGSVLRAQGPPERRLPPTPPERIGVTTITPGPATTAQDLALAMDIPTGDVVSATIGASDPRGIGVADEPLGAFFPTAGDTFAVLATGLAIDAGTPDDNDDFFDMPDTGFDKSTILDGLNNPAEKDLVQLTLVLKPPPEATGLNFDFAFYSEEFPEFINTVFNDAFIAELGAEPFASELTIIGDRNINSPHNFALDPNNEVISINAAFGFDPNNLNPDTGTTYDGTSGLLRATGCLPENLEGNVVLVLSITDMGDSIFDSAVFLDNFEWGNRPDCTPSVEEQPGTIEIYKSVNFGDAWEFPTFPFTSTMPGQAEFVLPNRESITVENLPPGSYQITELVPPGWQMPHIDCSDPQAVVNLNQATATIPLGAAETVQCFFDNLPQTGTIILEKVVVGAPPTANWQFEASAPLFPNGQFRGMLEAAGGTVEISGVPVGQYTITEAASAPPFELTNLICSETTPGKNPSNTNLQTKTAVINLDPNETVHCTFTNTRQTPTAIELASFEVEANDGRAMILWETATEIDNAGFNVYRAPAPNGPWVQVNQKLIAAEGDPVAGAGYNFVDTPGRGVFYYQLEDIDYYGVSTRHDAVKAEMGPTIRLPWYRPALPNFK